MKILLTGGGTQGHVSGNMALVPTLKEKGITIDYVGTAKGMERAIVAQDEYIKYHIIPAGKLNRSFTWRNFRNAFRVIKGISAAKKLIRELKPDIVFSKGGFVTVPVVIAAKKSNIPVIIHESDFTPGLANKISSKYADKICTTFPETVGYFHSEKAVCTGSPIRGEIFTGNRELGYKICGFTQQKPTIMVMGGSSGALALNQLTRAVLNDVLSKYNVIHICGKDGTDPQYEGINGYKQFGYVSSELRHLFAATDMTLSRSGSNAIFEFLALKIPMLLVPLPKGNSRGDQIVNAESFEKSGFATVCQQEDLTPELLVQKLDELYKKRDEIKANMEGSALLNGTNTILDLIFDMAKI